MNDGYHHPLFSSTNATERLMTSILYVISTLVFRNSGGGGTIWLHRYKYLHLHLPYKNMLQSRGMWYITLPVVHAVTPFPSLIFHVVLRFSDHRIYRHSRRGGSAPRCNANNNNNNANLMCFVHTLESFHSSSYPKLTTATTTILV